MRSTFSSSILHRSQRRINLVFRGRRSGSKTENGKRKTGNRRPVFHTSQNWSLPSDFHSHLVRCLASARSKIDDRQSVGCQAREELKYGGRDARGFISRSRNAAQLAKPSQSRQSNQNPHVSGDKSPQYSRQRQNQSSTPLIACHQSGRSSDRCDQRTPRLRRRTNPL